MLLISEDLDEILALNDRILVMYEGELSAVAPGVAERATQIGLRMAGIHLRRGTSTGGAPARSGRLDDACR